MRRVAVLAGCLVVVGLGCWAAAPLARAYEPPEPLTLTDPVGDAVTPDGGGPVGPDVTSVTVSQPDPETLRIVVTFAEPLVLRETAPVVEDGVRVMLGHPLGSQMYGNYVAWVGAADPTRVLLSDVAKPWRPGSVVVGGAAHVDGRVLTLTMPTEPLRARTRYGRSVDPQPADHRVRPHLAGMGLRRADRRDGAGRYRRRHSRWRGHAALRVVWAGGADSALERPAPQGEARWRRWPRCCCSARTPGARGHVACRRSGQTPGRGRRSSGSSRMLSCSAPIADRRRSLLAVALVVAGLVLTGCHGDRRRPRARLRAPRIRGRCGWRPSGRRSRGWRPTAWVRCGGPGPACGGSIRPRGSCATTRPMTTWRSRRSGERSPRSSAGSGCSNRAGCGASTASGSRPRCPPLWTSASWWRAGTAPSSGPPATPTGWSPASTGGLDGRWRARGPRPRGDGRILGASGADPSGGLWFQRSGFASGLVHWDDGTWAAYPTATDCSSGWAGGHGRRWWGLGGRGGGGGPVRPGRVDAADS